jgi:hemoglobin
MRYRNLFALLCAFALALGCGSSKPKTDPTGGGGGGGGGSTDGGGGGAGGDDTKPANGGSLFERLGGMPAVKAVVEEFVNRTTTDPRIKHRFFNTDAENLKKLLAEFVCFATGGGCEYTGRDMATSHAGMDLVDDEFTALVENLAGALDKFEVKKREKDELLGALGPLKPQIVVDASKLKPIDAAALEKVTALAGTLEDKAAAELLGAAVVAGQRGQRSYAEQLFTRAEMMVGAKPLASVAATFRAGAPPRVTTAVKTVAEDTPAQPKSVGNSDDDEPVKKPAKGSLTGTLKVDGAPLSGMGVVMLTPKGGGGKKRVAKHRIIEQRDKTFAPHVMAVPVGSTVEFPNFDKIFHNVFSLSKAKPFDLGMFKSGESREVKFDKAGIIRIGCNIHANMSAYLIVVGAPHYVVVDGDDGSFKFRSLKPGKYKVQAWSEQSAEPTVSEVVIKEGKNEVALDIKGGAVMGPGEDKFGQSRAAEPAAEAEK